MIPSLDALARMLNGDVRGDEVLCPGPGHSAKDRSLSVKPGANGGDTFAVYSFANDDPLVCKDFVRSKLGLEPFEARRKRVVVRSFDYRQADGTPHLRVQRTEPKGFFQQHWNCREWVNGGAKGPAIPYRLPDLIAAIRAEATIFVVEGETKVEALHKIDVPATCNAGGAGKWKADLDQYFAGAEVVVVPDNDVPGRDHAQQVAARLAAVNAKVRILELPPLREQGDVVDWLAAGGTADELFALAKAAPVYQEGNGDDARPQAEPGVPLPFIDMSDWDDRPVPPRQWAVPDRIPLRQPTLLSGEGSVGKSILLLQLAAAHVLGRDWLGTMPELGPVIYFGAEDESDELHRRLADIAVHYHVRFADLIKGGLHLLSFAGKDALLGSTDRAGVIRPTRLFDKLHTAAVAIRPVSVFLDTVADVFAGNENDRSQVRQFIGLLRGLSIEANCGIVIASHPSLTGINTGTGLSGSTGWHNSVRARAYLRKAKTEAGDEPDPDLRELEFMKSNYSKPAGTVRLRWRNGVFVPEPTVGSLEKLAAEQKADGLFLRLLDRFTEQGRNVSDKLTANAYAPKVFAGEQAAKDLKLRQSDLADAMRRLFAADQIHVVNYGRPSRQHSRIARRPRS